MATYQDHLMMMENVYDEDRLKVLLSVVSHQIALTQMRVKMLKESDSIDDYNELMFDLLIEDLLGIAYVIFQSSATNILTLSSKIYKLAKEDGVTLDKRFSNKSQLLKICDELPDGEYTDMEILNAGANMFKHKNEWGSWLVRINDPGINKNEKETLFILRSVGCDNMSFANFRLIFKTVMKTENYSDMSKLSEIYRLWKGIVSSEIMFELEEKDLI